LYCENGSEISFSWLPWSASINSWSSASNSGSS
jgi:hypothetical protein